MWSRINFQFAARQPLFLSIVFASIITVTGTALLLLDAQRLTATVYTQAERQGELLFSTIGQQVSDSLYFDDIEQIRKDAESIILQQEIARIAVFTTDGKYLLDSNQYKVPEGSIEPELLSLVQTHLEPLNRRKGNMLQFVGRIGFEGGTLGGLYLEFDLSDRLEATNQALVERSIWGLLIVILAAGLSFTIATASGTARSLKAIESNYKELIEQSPLPNAVFTTAGDLRYANPAFARLLSRSDYFSEDNYNIFNDPSLQKEQIIAEVRRGFKEGPVSIGMFPYSLGNGIEDLWISAVVFPLRDDHGSISEVVVIFRDVTAEKKADEDRARLNARLLQSQKLEGLGVMAGGIAHDFNNYLTPIQGYADLLSAKLPADLQPFAENIIKSTARAAELCSQLLAYAGRDSQTKKLISITDEVSQMSELLRSSLSKKATLEQALAPDLPMIMVDQTQLHQVLQNLIINASEALEDQVGTISLKTGMQALSADEAYNLLPAQSRTPGDYVFIEVSDTGVGMTTDIVENIFNPFFSTKFTGRGLGLSAVLGIVSNHEGGIVVLSKPGAGTTFRIYFPAEETIQGDNPAGDVARHQPGNYSGDVLLVDDEEDVLRVGKRILESLGFTVTVARNGKLALAEFKKNPSLFCCIVLDLMMPVMDGEKTLDEIRKIDPDIPIIAVTGYSGTDSTVRLSLQPNVTVLAKPYLIDDMNRVLATIFPDPVADRIS